MADWQRVLNLLPEWQDFKADDDAAYDEEKLARLASVVADRLEEMTPFGGDNSDIDEQRKYLVSDFRDFAKHPGDVEEFNSLMNELYDWADTPLDSHFGGKKVCWVKTF
jgi:hypothetical protein